MSFIFTGFLLTDMKDVHVANSNKIIIIILEDIFSHI